MPHSILVPPQCSAIIWKLISFPIFVMIFRHTQNRAAHVHKWCGSVAEFGKPFPFSHHPLHNSRWTWKQKSLYCIRCRFCQPSNRVLLLQRWTLSLTCERCKWVEPCRQREKKRKRSEWKVKTKCVQVGVRHFVSYDYAFTLWHALSVMQYGSPRTSLVCGGGVDCEYFFPLCIHTFHPTRAISRSRAYICACTIKVSLLWMEKTRSHRRNISIVQICAHTESNFLTRPNN